jgi:hypothetical protein
MIHQNYLGNTITIKIIRTMIAKMESGLAKFTVQPKYLFLFGGNNLVSSLLK